MSIENLFQENPIINIQIYIQVANIFCRSAGIGGLSIQFLTRKTSLENHLEYNLIVLRPKWI